MLCSKMARIPTLDRTPASELFGEPGRLELLSQAAHIVLLDDEPINLRWLTAVMQQAGFHSVTSLTDGYDLEALVREAPPDLVITDVHMPGFDGFAVLQVLQPLIVEERLPVLMITGDSSAEVRRRALANGAKDFVTKPFDAIEVTLRVKNLLETRILFRDLQKQNRTLLESTTGQTRELESTRIEMIERLALAAEYRDESTNQHNQRVGELSARIAEVIGLTPEDASLLRRAAALHDIGKIGIPDGLLRKPSRLTPSEQRVMQTHTSIGARIVGGSHVPLLKLVETVALSHHEHWDGSGYPKGLAGDEIPLPGRIVAVADAFDALSSDRPYRAALTVDETLEIMRKESGKHFEPRLVDALFAVRENVEAPLQTTDERRRRLYLDNVSSSPRARRSYASTAPHRSRVNTCS
ncbi:MAG: HD domain-containing phosphohydrolase [Vicinamibacterales bacterium]